MTKLLNTDCICIINLPHRRDRLNKLLEQIKFDKDNIVVFPGVYYKFEKSIGVISKLENDIINGPSNYLSHRNTGGAGCFLAFYRAFKWMLKRGYENMLIMEDDLILNKKFVEIYNTVIAPKINDKDVGRIMLCADHSQNYKKLHNILNLFNNDDYRVEKNMNTFSTNSFVIKKEDVQKYVNFIENIDLKKNMKYDLGIDFLLSYIYNYYSRNCVKITTNNYAINIPLTIDSGIVRFESNTINENLTYNQYQDFNLNIYKLINQLDNIDKNKKYITSLKNLIKTKYIQNNDIKLKIKVIGYNGCNHNFLNYFFKRYISTNIEFVNEDPNIILVSVFEDDKNKVIKYLQSNPNAIKIFFTGQNTEKRYKWYDDHLLEYVDIAFGFKYNMNGKFADKYIRFPLWLSMKFDNLRFDDLLQNPYVDLNKYFKEHLFHKYKKDKWCVFITRWIGLSCGKRKYVYDILNKYNSIECLSDCMNNSDFLKKQCKNNIHSALKHYKYNLCCENSDGDGYVTEKIFNCLYNGCIPIYTKRDQLIKERIFNIDKFIFADDNLLEKIKEFENEDKYESWKKMNIFNENANKIIKEYYNKLQQKIKEVIKQKWKI